MKSIVLTGGGTGGHVIPALALLPELKKKFDRIIFIGGSGMEKKLAVEKGLPFYGVTTVKFDRKNIIHDLKIPFLLHKGIAECREIFDKEKPEVVFSKGGYVALPACFAAKKVKIPVVCHESDYTLGLANKITSPFAAKTLVSFPSTEGGIFVGNPIREEILQGNKERAIRSYPIKTDKKTVLIFGGSQGASALNKVVYAALETLTKRYNVIHVSGKTGNFIDYPDSLSYRQMEFSSDMPDLFALADVVVCRGGSNTLFEVAAVGKPALCIPLPKGNSRGDQLLNAEYFQKSGFIDVLPQDKLSEESLLKNIESTLRLRPTPLDLSATNRRIAEEIFSVIK